MLDHNKMIARQIKSSRDRKGEEELDAFCRRLGNQTGRRRVHMPQHGAVPDEIHTSKRIILGSLERTPLASLTE